MLGLPSLPRKFEAALRDITASRAEIRGSALVDLLRYADSERSRVSSAIGQLLQSDPDAEVRALAALAAADAELRELVPGLLRALDDKSPRVQQMALLALGEQGEGLARAELGGVERLLASKLPALRYQALVAWSRLTGPEGVAALLAATSDPDEEVRWIAWTQLEAQLFKDGQPNNSGIASSASTMPRPEVKAALAAQAQDPSMRIRVVVAAILYRLGEPAALTELLERAQRGTKISRRELARLAKEFGRLRFEPARAWLKASARRGWLEGAVGWPALVALAALGDPAARASVVDELDARSIQRRHRALQAVSEISLESAMPRLRALRANPGGVDPSLIEQAWDALQPRSPVR